MKAFGVFEGGGVRGYAHIGALRAVERRKIEFEQVAGTSIGAVIAALVAAGYRADDLYKEVDGKAEGAAVIAFDTLFSADDWRSIGRMARDARRLHRVSQWLEARGFRSPIDMSHPLGAAVLGWIATPFIWIAAPFVYPRYRRAHASLWRHWGAVDASPLRAWLDTTLRQRLAHVPDDREIQFVDLKTPLRVVVADVQSGALKVVGDNPHDHVVDAVIASASVPFFFRPQRRDGSIFVDGGMLSNVPAWVFDRERAALAHSMPTLTFRLIPTAALQALAEAATLARFAPRLLGTALDGARQLELRRINDHHMIPLDADIGILDFDKLEHERATLVTQGESCAETYFRANLGPFDPVDGRKALKAIASIIKQVLRIAGYVRVCAILPLDEEYLRVACAANMDEDLDDQLLIRRSSLGPGLAFARKEPVIVTVDRLDPAQTLDPLFKYEYLARPRALKTICAVPFFADPADWLKAPDQRQTPMGLLAFDADETMRTKLVDLAVEDAVASYAQFVGERFRRNEVKAFGVDIHGAEDGGNLLEIVPGVEVYDRKERSLRMDRELVKLQSELATAA